MQEGWRREAGRLEERIKRDGGGMEKGSRWD